MALDPQVRAVLDQMAALGGPPIDKLSVSEVRNQSIDMAVMQGAPEPVSKIEDRKRQPHCAQPSNSEPLFHISLSVVFRSKAKFFYSTILEIWHCRGTFASLWKQEQVIKTYSELLIRTNQEGSAMKSVLRWALLGGAVWLVILGSNAAAIAQTSGAACTREGLKAITDKFFTALEAHNPSGAPLASGVKYTENGTVVAVGKGTWTTAGKTMFNRGMVDTQKCGTHTQAIIDEGGKSILYGVRLKVDKDKISEIEAIVVRGAQVLNAKNILDSKDQDWEGILPPEQRSSRLAMMAAADDYFDLFVQKQTQKVSALPYSKPCDRWENGQQTTAGGTNQGVAMPPHNCSPKGFADMADTHTPRRFLVDVETGVVVAYTLFNNQWPDFHMFKMRNGYVELIQAYFEYGKKYDTIGWPIEPACK
jgi:hypothetical protein